MKVLSLYQPHASLCAIGAKRIETRGWETSYRGWIAIHATIAFPPEYRECCSKPYFREVLEPVGLIRHGVRLSSGGCLSGAFESWLPHGAILGVCRLVEVRPAYQISIDFDLLPGQMERHAQGVRISGREFAFGDYRSRRFALFLEDVRPLAEPIPARGWQRLWNFEHPELERLAAE
jgi:activating signal cointegrator 1